MPEVLTNLHGGSVLSVCRYPRSAGGSWHQSEMAAANSSWQGKVQGYQRSWCCLTLMMKNRSTTLSTCLTTGSTDLLFPCATESRDHLLLPNVCLTSCWKLSLQKGSRLKYRHGRIRPQVLIWQRELNYSSIPISCSPSIRERFSREAASLQDCCFTWQSFFLSAPGTPLIYKLPL